MIVPQYWAEARVQARHGHSQFTVRRFGWSDTSQAEAQSNASRRANEALQRIVSGEKLPRREAKIAYNGAQGVPIREEIVSRHGETIITRNSYGARCLNTPNVLFVDIDLNSRPSIHPITSIFILLALAVAAGLLANSKVLGVSLIALVIYLNRITLRRTIQQEKGDPETVARSRIHQFVENHPEWNLRIYRTPSGFRALATHQTFDPNDPVVAECFRELGADPVYVRMCLNQHCFRARVSPKPWRIGIEEHIKPRPGAWPVAPERVPMRNAWIEQYEAVSQQFAACKLVEIIGSGTIHPEAKLVQELHDQLGRATSELPLA